MFIRLRRLVILVLAIAILLLSGVGVAAYTELITNGTFDIDVSSWDATSSGTIAHQTDTVHSGVGAATITNSYSAATSYTAGAEQAIGGITGGNYYGSQAYAYIPNSSDATSTLIRLAWYTTSDCSGSQLTTVDSSEQTTKDQWNFMQVYAQAPATAQCFKVRLFVRKSGASSQAAFFDDVSAYRTTTNAVSLRSLGANTLPALLTALAALITLVVGGVAVWRQRFAQASQSEPASRANCRDHADPTNAVYAAPQVISELQLEARAGSPLAPPSVDNLERRHNL